MVMGHLRYRLACNRCLQLLLCFLSLESFATSAPGSTLFRLAVARLLLHPAVRAAIKGMTMRIALIEHLATLTNALVAPETDAEIKAFALASLLLIVAIDASEPLVLTATLLIGPHVVWTMRWKRFVGRHADDGAQLFFC